MKKLLFFLAFTFSGFTFSQEQVTTTEEEYNYLTQGYKISLENGTDLKKGYELKKIQEDVYSNYKYVYYYFIHSESKKTKAIFVTITKEKGKKDKEEFLCIPINNEELFKKFIDKTYDIGLNMKHYFNYSTYKVLSKSIDEIANK